MKYLSKSSQAAMEFLLTYGWAILAALVLFSSLIYFGILAPNRFLPNLCTINSHGLLCKDYTISYERYPAPFSPYKNILRLYIINTGGSVKTLRNLKIQQGKDFPELPEQNIEHDLPQGQSYLVQLDMQKIPPIPKGKKVVVEFTMETRNSDTGLTHYHKGRVRTRIG